MSDLLQYMIISYLALVTISAVLALVMHIGQRSEVTLNGLLYWLVLLPSFLIQGFIGNNELYTSLAMLLFLGTSLLIVRIFENIFLISMNRKLFWNLVLAPIPVWFLLRELGFSFEVYTLILAMGLVAPLFIVVVKAFYSNTKKTSSTYVFLVSTILTALHVLDYPFLRLIPEAAVYGFMGGYFSTFLMAILIPMVITENIQASYTARLELDVARATADLKDVKYRVVCGTKGEHESYSNYVS